MGLEEGRKHNLEAGEFLKQPLPPIEFGRIAAQTAKQVISQKVREAERARQYQEYKDRWARLFWVRLNVQKAIL